MEANTWLEVRDRDGWTRRFVVEKSLVYIGSAPGNDLVLESSRGVGVDPRHAQLLSWPQGGGYRLVNLGGADIRLEGGSRPVIPPRSFADLSDGVRIRLGDFTLTFHTGRAPVASPPAAGTTAEGMPSAGVPADTSPVIQVRLVLSQKTIPPNSTVDGAVIVKNLGDQSGVQFDLELEGLDSECYEIGPGPILFPNAEREVFFRLYHRGHKPLAGDHRILIRATAPEAYPGEGAGVTETIHFLPFYRHRLRLRAAGTAGEGT